MKKTLKVLFFGIVVLASLLVYKYKKYEDEKFQASNQPTSDIPQEVTAKAEAFAVTNVIPKNVETLPEVVSLEQLENDFKNLDKDELEKILEESKNSLIRNALIEKANTHTLSSSEKETLRAEIRKQGVLNNLIAKNKIDEIKRKYAL